MAGVRDPAFWKRFSYAVHLDEEKGEKLGPQHDSYVINTIREGQLPSKRCC